MTELIVQPKSLGGLVRSLSGFFMTKDNPHGLSPKECTVIACLISITENNQITNDIKVELSNQLNQKYQVTLNYINKFKKKGVITKDDKLHPVFFKTKIVIEHGEDIL